MVVYGIVDEDLKDDAKDYFGTTDYWKVAFYINTDGTLLDGSGKKFGALGGKRTSDHRDVSAIMPAGTERTDAMLKYMEEGNIRFQPEARNFEIMKKPTYEQYDKLEELIDEFYDEVNIDIDDENGKSIAHFFHDYDEPASKIIAQIKRHFMNSEQLNEDTRSNYLAKSRRGAAYKGQKKANRWTAKSVCKTSNTVKDYNSIDMNTFWKNDILNFKVRVQGETDTYLVTIEFSKIQDRLQRELEKNNMKLEADIVYKALFSTLNSSDVKIDCSCPDFKYRFAFWASQHNDKAGEKENRRANITNPNDNLGSACKHILYVLNNLDWLKKIASVITNYINYCKENMEYNYSRFIFPKLYGMDYNRAVQLVINDYDEDGNLKQDLDTDEKVINLSNALGRVRGRIKKGSNKNPVASNKDN